MEIQRELKILQPQTISEAIGLAKLIEDKVKDSRPHFYANRQTIQPMAPPVSTPLFLTPPPLSRPAPSQYPIRRLSHAEQKDRRARGLCFKCDERFEPGHKCSWYSPDCLSGHHQDSDLISFCASGTLEHHPLPPSLPSLPSPNHTNQANIHFHLSSDALFGLPSPKTLRLSGLINGQTVVVLIDTGSSHNIIQSRVTKHLSLAVQAAPSFSVQVGNGALLQCTRICLAVPLHIQGTGLLLPMYILDIRDVGMVLGNQWLRSFGLMLADFAVPMIRFRHGATWATFSGDISRTPTAVTFNQFFRLFETDSVASCHTTFVLPLPEIVAATCNTVSAGTAIPAPYVTKLQQPLSTFQQVFDTPQGLPPQRLTTITFTCNQTRHLSIYDPIDTRNAKRRT